MKIYNFKTQTKGSKMNNNPNLSFRNQRNPLLSSLEMSRRINSRRRIAQRIRDAQSLEYNSENNRNISSNNSENVRTIINPEEIKEHIKKIQELYQII